MSWTDYIPSVPFQLVNGASGGTPFGSSSLKTVMFGGLGKSTNPADYAVANPQQAAINAAMGNPMQPGQQIQGMLGQQAAQVDPSQQAQFRAMQMQQAQQLQRIASGQQQGAGELAAQRQVGNALAAQQAQARMARGGQNAALAMRNAANNSAGIGLSGAGQSQQAALQDQQAAQGQLTGALQTGRSQDLGLGTTNAQLQQNQYGQNLGALSSMYGQNLGALTGLNSQQLQAQTGAMQATLGQQGMAGQLLSTAGQIGAAASDENLKTDIADGADDIDEMLNGLVAKTYRYKDEAKYGAGPRAGIMAQDLAKSKAGSALVVKLPDGAGLGFDVSKAVSAALAATARLNERMRKVEARG